MMTLERFSYFTNVFTPEFQTAVHKGAFNGSKYSYYYTAVAEPVMTVREALTGWFHAVIPDEVLDIMVWFEPDRYDGNGNIRYHNGELVMGYKPSMRPFDLVRVFFHEIKHLIDVYNGYPYVDLGGYRESFGKETQEEEWDLLWERRARYAETALIKQAYRLCQKGLR